MNYLGLHHCAVGTAFLSIVLVGCGATADTFGTAAESATSTLVPSTATRVPPASTATPVPYSPPEPAATSLSDTIDQAPEFEKLHEGALAELFPGSVLYMAERGDVVVVNQQTNLELAGQKIDTSYGSYTFLVSAPFYQNLIRNLIGEETLDAGIVLTPFPTSWRDYPGFDQAYLDLIGSIEKLQGYRDGGEQLVGYPNLAEIPPKYMEEFVRVISTLLALGQGEISLASVDLATYQPNPKDFVMIHMSPGNNTRLSGSLPSGLIDLTNPAWRPLSTTEVWLMTVKTDDDVFIDAVLRGPHSGEPGVKPEVFYEVFLEPFVKDPIGFLMIESRRTQNLAHDEGTNPFFEGPFAPLYSNPELYYHLTAYTEWYPIQPPFGADIRPEQSGWKRFGVEEIVELDLDNFK